MSKLITQSLISSFYYYLINDDRQDFIDTLKRIQKPQTERMLAGIEFEKKCCKGKDEVISPIIENGQFQVKLGKHLNIDNEDYYVYGVLDVLKAGVIYDIKSTVRYENGKFYKSPQHDIYMWLVDEAIKFTYLIECNGDYYSETYETPVSEREIIVKRIISEFIEFIKKDEELYNLYLENWEDNTK